MNMRKTEGIKQISGWQTTDGVVHESKPQAEEHQNQLDFLTWCKANLGHLSDVGQLALTIYEAWHVAPRPGVV